jgi:hypothetical protein
MYKLDREKLNVQPCRKYYQIGSSFCAMGALLRALGFQIPQRGDDFYIASPETSDFIVEVGCRLGNMRWAAEVADINDSMSGTLDVNFKKALLYGIECLEKSGVIEPERELAGV